MDDRNTMIELFNQIKTIVDNYMKNRKPASVVLGIYTGMSVKTGMLPVPMSMIIGNMKEKLVVGDQVLLLRNDGGKEYYILEVIGKPYQTTGG